MMLTPTTTHNHTTMSSTTDTTTNDCKTLAQVCCVGLCVITVAGCVFAYIIMGIIILVDDYTVWHDCDNNSELWAYCLVAILLCWTKASAKDTMDGDGDGKSDAALVISAIAWTVLIELGLAIWGAVELFDESEKTCCKTNNSANFINGTCNELTDTRLWTFGLATNIISWIVLGIIIIFTLVCAVSAACDRRQPTVTASTKFHRPPSPYPHTSCVISNV